MITYIDPSRRIKTLISFVKGAIAKEDTHFTYELELMMVIRSEIRVTGTTKNFHQCIIWWFVK